MHARTRVKERYIGEQSGEQTEGNAGIRASVNVQDSGCV